MTLYARKRKKAGERTRTVDIQLGKLALYQLSYARRAELTGFRSDTLVPAIIDFTRNSVHFH